MSRGFSLLEVLVVMGIISLLLSILLPAISNMRRGMNKLKCASNLRSSAFAFQLFSEGESEGGQGDSEQLGRSAFFINDFQDSLYRVDEFWDIGGATESALDTSNTTMLCPSGATDLTKRKGFPCGRSAIGPLEDVTLAVNMRLFRAVVRVNGRAFLAPPAVTQVERRIINHPYVPLMLDVDGREAARRNLDPFYIAPPLAGTDDPYSDGRYWLPSTRHRGKTNVVFVGGHVLSSDRLEEENWNWAYQARVRRR